VNRDLLISSIIAVVLHACALAALGARMPSINPQLDDGAIAVQVVLAELVPPVRLEAVSEPSFDAMADVIEPVDRSRAAAAFESTSADPIESHIDPLGSQTELGDSLAHQTSTANERVCEPDLATPPHTVALASLSRPVVPPVAMETREGEADAPARDSDGSPPVSPAPIQRANPVAMRNPSPVYPALARRRGWEGVVELRVEVLATGEPGRIELIESSGHDILDEAAIEAVMKWTFQPALESNHPITRWIRVPIEFHIDQS